MKSVELMKLVSVRDARPEDGPFIYSTWLRALYYGSDYFSEIDQTDFFDGYRVAINSYLTRPGVAVKVACLVEDPDVIVGYAVYQPELLHFVYVKRPWRKLGIASLLVPSTTSVVTSLTILGKACKPAEWRFNPFR